MIQLIASDMDGTLLDAKMNISEENKQAILHAQKQGITFMVATGRGLTEAKPSLDEAGIDCPMITVNGAQAFDSNGKILFTIGIERKNAQKIMKIFEQHQVYYEIATDHGVYSNHMAQRIENGAAMIARQMPHLTYKTAVMMTTTFLESLHIVYVDDYQEVLDQKHIQILKFIVFNELGSEVLDPLRESLKEVADIIVTSSSANNIEVNHCNANKGAAVQHMAKRLNIPLENVMTIGDNFNDVSMLQLDCVSFAMGNAEEKVKKIAKYETDTNLHSGVGKAILRSIEENL